ncbi:hypothetical protein SDC9_175085 [bioreactor metagenome]|uniref:Uncharacterized protein n=1 Tax=bioreactor metagenome TaxID=1076179 RepID=A0A645GL22_9ZZZZ
MAEQRGVHLCAAYHQNFPCTGREHRFVWLSSRAKERKLRVVPGRYHRNTHW